MTGSNIKYAVLSERQDVVILKSERHGYYTDQARYIRGHKSAYKSGYRYCSGCELFIKIDGRYCPKCGMLTRVKPRYSKSRGKNHHYY